MAARKDPSIIAFSSRGAHHKLTGQQTPRSRRSGKETAAPRRTPPSAAPPTPASIARRRILQWCTQPTSQPAPRQQTHLDPVSLVPVVLARPGPSTPGSPSPCHRPTMNPPRAAVPADQDDVPRQTPAVCSAGNRQPSTTHFRPRRRTHPRTGSGLLASHAHGTSAFLNRTKRYPTWRTKEQISMALQTTRRSLAKRTEAGDRDGGGAR